MDKLSGKNSAVLMVVVVVLGGILWVTGIADKLGGGTPTSSSGADRPASAIEMKVGSVSDSGTFSATVVTTARSGDRGVAEFGEDPVEMRLNGLITPGASFRQECFAEEAKKVLEDRISESARRIWVKPAGRGEDRRGRALAWVWTKDGELVQEGQLADGAAALLDTRLSPYEDQLVAAEKKAKGDGTGMWGACDTDEIPTEGS